MFTHFRPAVLAAALLTMGWLATAPANAGVLGYWPFDDPADPTTAFDAAGNGNDGQIDFNESTPGGAAPIYTASGEGFSGQPGDHALRFEQDSGAFVWVPSKAVPGQPVGALESISTNNQFTIAMWFFGGDVQPINQFHFWGGDRDFGSPNFGGNGNGFASHVPWSNGTVFFDTAGCCGGDTQRIAVPAAENLWKGSWNHWLFIKDGDYKAIYANGVKLHEGVNTDPIPPEAVDCDTCGAFWGGGPSAGGLSYAIDGLLDDVILFDEALTDSADGSTRVSPNQPAEQGSQIWQLFQLGAVSFVQPNLTVSRNVATIDEIRASLLIGKACNENQAVTYTITSSDPNVIALAGDGTVPFDAGAPPGAFVDLVVGAPGTATLSTANDGSCDDHTPMVTVFAINAADLKIVTAGMEVGDTQQSVVVGSYSDAGMRDVTGPSTGTTYTSSDSNVATVDANGVITAVGVGSADITASNGGVSSVEMVNVAEQLTSIAFLVGKLEFNEGDQGVLDLLTSLRFSGDPGQLDANGIPPKVIPMDDDTFDEVVVEADFDLVLVSSTVDADKVGGRFRCLNVPMVFWAPGLILVNNEGLAASSGTSAGSAGPEQAGEFTDLFLLDFTHPITQGVAADADGFTAVYDSPQDISWAGVGSQARVDVGTGVLATGAESLAEYEFLDESTLIVAEAGGNRLGSSSVFLARRVFLWLEDETADNLNDVGQGIVTSGINWALGGERIPLVLSLLTISGPSQMATGQEFQYTVEGSYRGCVTDVTLDATTAYTSSDESVATVSDTGVVRGVGAGMATITAMSGVLQLEGSINVTVVDIAPLTAMDFETTGPTTTAAILSFFDLFGANAVTGGENGWSITGGALSQSSDGGALINQFSRVAILRSQAFEAQDLELSLDITWNDDDLSGVYVRANDFTGDDGEPRNFYYVQFSGGGGGDVTLYKRKNGEDTELGTFTSPVLVSEDPVTGETAPITGETHRITVRVAGNTISAWVDGEAVPGLDPFTDADPVTGVGRIGVGQQTNPSTFDNFALEALEVVALPPALAGDDTIVTPTGCSTDFTFETTEDVAVGNVVVSTSDGSAPGATVTSGSLQVSLDAPLSHGVWVRLDVDVTGQSSGQSATLTVFLAYQGLDINGDGRTNISDATAFGAEFNGGKDPSLIDLNCDGVVNIQDATAFGNLFTTANGTSLEDADKP